jgi:ribosomal protein S24E
MKLNIITENKNDLLGRKDFIFNMEFDGATPKTADVKKEIASISKSKEEVVVIKVIKNNYGQGKAEVRAHIYDSLDDLKKLEKYEEPVKAEESKEE